MSEDPTRVSRLPSDPPPPPPPAEPPRRDDGGGHGWQLFAVALVALILGAGAAWLIHGDSDDGGRTTVREVRRTVTVPSASTAAATTPEPVTVTQPPAETVVKTTTVPVTVTVTPTVTEP